jgi:hypothetical protein
MTAPPFDQAVGTFQDFLEAQGWPTEIVWARPWDIGWKSGALTVRTSETLDARNRYDLGRRAGLGVMLEAHCTIGSLTCASVGFPRDEGEAERLMYPSDGSLKLGVAVRRVEGLQLGSSSSDG